MIKNVKNLIIVAMACMVGLMAGCGGGGEDPTILDGTASKGIIYPGTVAIFVVDAGVKASAPLMTVQTNQDGKFTADLGFYEGPIVIEVTGKYTDEASAATVTIDAANPLRAAIYDVSSLSNGKRCAVTPPDRSGIQPHGRVPSDQGEYRGGERAYRRHLQTDRHKLD